MAKNPQTHKRYSLHRAPRVFRVGLGAAAALFGIFGGAPLWAQDDLGEDFISDIFMEASEGMPNNAAEPQEPAPEPESLSAVPAPVIPVSTEAGVALPGAPGTPSVNKKGGKPPRHAQAAAPPLEEAPAEAPPAASEGPLPDAMPVPAPDAPSVNNVNKKGGKPPRHAPSTNMPTAVLEPEGAPPAPAHVAEAPPPSASGERPLPVPPGEENFLEPEDLTAGTDTAGVTLPINLGALPSLEWETTDPSAPMSRFISDSPLPQFDPSASSWKQLAVGQEETVAPPPPPERPGTVSTVTEAAAPPPQSAGTDRAQLRGLFSDMLPPPGQGTQAAPPPSPPPARAPVATPAKKPGRIGGKPDLTPQKVAASPAGEPAPEGAVSLEEEVGGSAILRAGGQLTVAGHFGEAAILPPLAGGPNLAAWMEAQQKAEAEAQQAAAPADTKGREAKAASPPKPAAARTAPKSAAQSSSKARPAAPPVRSQLSLVNETGNDRMLEVYRSVLSQMGYQVVNAETRQPVPQPTGEALIAYRPGLRARARAVAGHLPGRKTLVESTAALPTEIAIYLR